METYYTKKEYNEMKNSLTRKIKNLEKRIASLEVKNADLKDKLAKAEVLPDLPVDN